MRRRDPNATNWDPGQLANDIAVFQRTIPGQLAALGDALKRADPSYNSTTYANHGNYRQPYVRGPWVPPDVWGPTHQPETEEQQRYRELRELMVLLDGMPQKRY